MVAPHFAGCLELGYQSAAPAYAICFWRTGSAQETLRRRPGTVNGGAPAADKTQIHEIVDGDSRGDQRDERSEQHGPAVLAHHLAAEQQNVARQFPVAARFAAQPAVSGAQPGEKLFLVPRARNFRVRRAHRGERMRVASGHLRLASLPGKLGGMLVGGGQHLAVAGLDGGEISGKPFVVVRVSPPGHGRKYVIYGEKQALLGKIGEQANHIVAPAVDLDVLALGDVIDADVGLGAARHACRSLLR